MMTNRKTATRLLILNWSRFQKLDFRLSGSTFVTGVNTSGKSTVLDAVSFLISGNRQFNKAAKDRDRSVLKYVRGDTESREETRYLRSGSVVSYIAMEFDSPVDGGPVSCIVCIESPNEEAMTPFWYAARGARLEDFNFYEETGNTRRTTPKDRLCLKGTRILSTEWKLGADIVVRALGIRSEMMAYRRKLVQMMAFNPNNNINQFIQECVLEGKKVNSLNDIRNHREKYEEARETYEGLGRQKVLLEKTEQATVKYEAQVRTLNVRRLLMSYQTWQIAGEREKENAREHEVLESQLKGMQSQLKQASSERTQAQEAYADAKSQDVLNNVKGTLDQLRREEQELERTREDAEKKSAELIRLQQYFGKELAWLVAQAGDDELAVRATHFAQTGLAPEIKTGVFSRLHQMRDFAEEQLSGEAVHLQDEVDARKQEIAELTEEIRALTANQLPLPKEVRRERDVLSAALAAQGTEVQVRTFAELVEELKDESWRGAIETFLGNRRHDLIVDGPACLKALKIQEDRKLRNITLVLTDALEEREAEAGSAAELLAIPNVYARRYANFLLGRIHLCDTVEELHAHPQGGLMRSGLMAKSFATRFLHLENTRFCLGEKALKMQLEQLTGQRTEKQAVLAALYPRLDAIAEKRGSLKLVKWHEDSYDFSSPDVLQRANAQLAEVRRQVKIVEEDPNFATAMELLESARRRLDDAQKVFEDIYAKAQVLEERLNKNEDAVYALKEQAREARLAYESEQVQYMDLEGEMLALYADRVQLRQGKSVITDLELRSCSARLEEALRAMEDAQLEVLRVSEIDVNRRGPSWIPFFRERMRALSNVKIEEAKALLATSRSKLEYAFVTDFVAELNESMDLARVEIESINKELRLLPFGNDTYRFVLGQRADRALFFRISQKLQNYLFNPDLLKTAGEMDEEFEHDLDTFMSLIFDEGNEEELSDYRSYLTYDMEITTRQGQQEVVTMLSRKNGSASGGEKQTPYYIILAASLIQCYPRDTCCARLALVDEAFSAMSDDRIEQMVQYLENNGFQVIYSAPPQKVGSIGSHIGTTVSLVQSGRFTHAVEGLIRLEE